MSKEFECKREVLIPATPEEVWDAVATEHGNTAWLFPNEIPVGDVNTIWDPPRHFAVRMENGDWFNALDFRIEGREGEATLLRYMHSGIFVDNWDTQFDAVSQHTDFYLHTLVQYLTHFKGRPATYIGGASGGLQGPEATSGPEGFHQLQKSLGLSSDVKLGEKAMFTPATIPAFEGVVDYLQPNFLGIRTSDALYRFFGRNAFGAPVGMSIHIFTASVDVEKITKTWQNWLDTALVSTSDVVN